MKFVRCDKCGKEYTIAVDDSGYVCIDKNVDIYKVEEISVMGNKFDLCRECREKLKKEKTEIEKIFCESMLKEKTKEDERYEI